MRWSEISLAEAASAMNPVAPATFYHGSRRVFRPGTVLRPQRGGYVHRSGYPAMEKRVGRLCEGFLEQARPADAVSRLQAVFMVDDPAIIERVGGYDNHVYSVQPEETVTRCNLYWYSQLESYCYQLVEQPDSLQPDDVRAMAHSYWKALPNDLDEPHRDQFEYLTASAMVISKVK